MNRLNFLFTLSSLSVVLVTIERFSPTTKIIFQPYSFLRLHEIIQMTVLILITVIIPFLILREITGNFETLKNKYGFLLFLIFLMGVYFYCTGNGLHELASFEFNNFCNEAKFSGDLCGGFFFNDYYTGNIVYFFGGILMVVPLLLFQKIKPYKEFTSKQIIIALTNALIYAFAIFAYAAFDRVLVGLVYSLFLATVSDVFFINVYKSYRKYPLITYTAATYTLGALAALAVRLL